MNLDATQLFTVIEQRSLEREISRVRQELELTEKKIHELEHRVRQRTSIDRVENRIFLSLKIPMKQFNSISNV